MNVVRILRVILLFYCSFGFSFHLALAASDVEEVDFDDVLTEKEARAMLADYIGKGNTWNRFYEFSLI